MNDQVDEKNNEESGSDLQSSEDQIRLEKIAAIRAQLAAGSYNISGKDVAEKILTFLKN